MAKRLTIPSKLDSMQGWTLSYVVVVVVDGILEFQWPIVLVSTHFFLSVSCARPGDIECGLIQLQNSILASAKLADFNI